MSTPDLSKLPPEALSALQAHESSVDAESSPPIDLASLETIRALSAQLEEAQRRASAAESRATSLESRLTATSRLLTRAEKEARCVPTIIGGSDGIPPSSDFDIKITASPLSDNESVAWIPVILWPIPVAETRGGRTFYNIGRTTVRESYAICTLMDAQGKPRHYALSGFASLSVVTELTPDEVADRIAQSDTLGLLARLTDDDVPGTSAQAPFIPSQASSSRPAPWSSPSDKL